MNLLNLFTLNNHNPKKSAENKKNVSDSWGYELYRSIEFRETSSQDLSNSKHKEMDYFLIR